MSAAAGASSPCNDWCPCDAVCSLVSGEPTHANTDSQCSQHATYPAGVMSSISWDESMADSVKSHAKHILIAHGSDAKKWAHEVTEVAGSYAEALDNALQKAKQLLPFKVRASLCDAPTLDALDEDRPLPDQSAEDAANPHLALDLLIFPDAIRVRQVRKDQLDEFVQALAEYSKQRPAAASGASAVAAPANSSTAAGTPAAGSSAASSASSSSAPSSSSSSSSGAEFPMPHVRLPGTYFLICCHKMRDKRCGVAGPLLVSEIDRVISTSYPSSPTPQPVHALKISHIGGHKFAGNVIVYPPGVWYGKVLPCHIPHLILAHCPGFEYVDTSSGERVVVTRDDTNAEAEQAKLKPLIRGFVDSEYNRQRGLM